jgi:hypothetical protein
VTQTGLFPRVSLDVFGYTIFIVTIDKNFMVQLEREKAFCRPKIFTSIYCFWRGRVGNTFDVVKWFLSPELST